jgi:DNA-binding NtrC family response regulator
VLEHHSLMRSELKILIQGETGTGKTYLAGKIHERSGRPGAFVAVNLSSFNPQLIESELFGHLKGSFTGAMKDKLGAFELAEGGTLFMDEIDSLPLETQIKLLTFIDNNRFRRVGDTREREIRTRMIFAAGRPLESLVQQGLFRRDFYFRLKSGHTLELAPLRNNTPQIGLACHHFGQHKGVAISERLVEFYESLAWPGNLRQLQGHLEKKRVLCRTHKLDFDHLDEELLLQSTDLMSISAIEELVPMEQYKGDYVKRALLLCEGNIALTARKLRLCEKTVRSLVKS